MAELLVEAACDVTGAAFCRVKSSLARLDAQPAYLILEQAATSIAAGEFSKSRTLARCASEIFHDKL